MARSKKNAKTETLNVEKTTEQKAVDAEQTLRYAADRLRRAAADARRNVDHWAERFAKDPFDAMRWGDEAAVAAAQVKVYGQTLDAIDHRGDDGRPAWTWTAIEEYVRDEVLRRARAGLYRSTSPMMNTMEAQELKAFGSLLADHLKGLVRYERRLAELHFQLNVEEHGHGVHLQPVDSCPFCTDAASAMEAAIAGTSYASAPRE